MTAKEYLSRYRTLNDSINAKIAQVEELRRRAQTVGSGGNGAGAHSTQPHSRVGEITERLVDLEREINEEIDRSVDVQRQIRNAIAAVPEGRCERPRAFGKRNSEADRFRNTKAWRRMADVILERDFHCCRVCAKAGVINSRELSVHHITPLAVDFGRRLDEGNLITLCRYHHEQAEKGRINPQELRALADTPLPLGEFAGLNATSTPALDK